MRMLSTAFFPQKSIASDLFQFLDEAQNHQEWMEEDQKFFLSLDLPGVKKEDLKIELAGRTLNLTAERRHQKDESKSYVSLRRSYLLPVTVDETKIEAHLDHGVLTLVLPKQEKEQPKLIQIQ